MSNPRKPPGGPPAGRTPKDASSPAAMAAAARAHDARQAAEAPDPAKHATPADRDPAGTAEYARYGPRSTPLFYTALQKSPERLTWDGFPGVSAWSLSLGEPRPGGRLAPIHTATVSAPVWPFPNLQWETGTLYAWRVEPASEPEADRPVEEGMSDPPALEGRFWLLPAASAARLERGRQILAQGTESDFAAIALALLMAELGLYQEALLLVKTDSARRTRPARVLLAHIVQALVYRQMEQQLKQEELRIQAGLISARFAAWAANREQYHRQQATTQMEGGRTTLDSETLAMTARLLEPMG